MDHQFIKFLNEHGIKVESIHSKQSNIELINNICNLFSHLNIRGIELNHCLKDNKISLEYRQRANRSYIKKINNYDTLCMYNKSIAYAECTDNTECLSIAFANRSALLFEMGYFKDCIKDIEHAKSYDYPLHLLPKLEKRYEKAKASESETKTFKFHEPIPKLTSAPHKLFKGVSDAINLVHDDVFSRHIIATKDINVGDVLTIEEPYEKYLLKGSCYEFCNYCFEKVLTLIPCDCCSDAMFCDEICKNDAKNKGIHKYVCGLSSALTEIYDKSNVLVAFFAALKDLNGIVMDKENKIQSQDSEEVNIYGLTIKNGIIVHDTEPDLSIYSHGENAESKLFYYCNHIATLIREMELKSSIFIHLKDYFSNKELRTILIDLTYNHLSAFTPMTVICLKKVDMGVAMLPFNKLLNHSCFKNVVLVYYGSTAVLRCLRPIKQNESIFCSYIAGDYTDILKFVRQSQLYERFKFKCNCVPCLKNWPMVDDGYGVLDEMLKNIEFELLRNMLNGISQDEPASDVHVTLLGLIKELLVQSGNNLWTIN